MNNSNMEAEAMITNSKRSAISKTSSREVILNTYIFICRYIPIFTNLSIYSVSVCNMICAYVYIYICSYICIYTNISIYT
jgi:hypothetical protein